MQQGRVPSEYGSLRRLVPNLVQAAHIQRHGFEQSGQHRCPRQAKGILSVAVTHSYPRAVPYCDSCFRLQMTAAAYKAEERARRKAVWQQMKAENATLRIQSGAAPGGCLAPPFPAWQSSPASSKSFASILSEPSIPARQPVTQLNVNSVRTITFPPSEPLADRTAKPVFCFS